MTKITDIDLGKVDFESFIETVESGIIQADNDATIIVTSTTLAELKPVLGHINARQTKIMKALKYLAENRGGG